MPIAVRNAAATPCRKRAPTTPVMDGWNPIATVVTARAISPPLNSVFLSVASARRPIGSSSAAEAPRNTDSVSPSSTPLASSSPPHRRQRHAHDRMHERARELRYRDEDDQQEAPVDNGHDIDREADRSPQACGRRHRERTAETTPFRPVFPVVSGDALRRLPADGLRACFRCSRACRGGRRPVLATLRPLVLDRRCPNPSRSSVLPRRLGHSP